MRHTAFLFVILVLISLDTYAFVPPVALAALQKREAAAEQAKKNLKTPKPQKRTSASFSDHSFVPPARPYADANQVFLAAGFARPQATLMDLRSVAGDRARFQTPTHEVSFTIVIARDTGWDLDRVNNAIAKAAEIYAPCGIRFRAVTTVLADLPNRFHAVADHEERLVVKAMPKLPKPTLFFVSRITDNAPAFSCTQNSNYHSLTGSTWFDQRILYPPRTAEIPNPAYPAFEGDRLAIPIAHEIAHILGNRDHVPPSQIANVLQGDGNYLSADITAEQCASFRANSEYVRPIRD